MKPYEARHLIAEFPDLTWEEIIEIHEGRQTHRIAEQRQKQEEARKMAKGVTGERHSFGLMSGARLYIDKFAPYGFWFEDTNGNRHGTEQEAAKDSSYNPQYWQFRAKGHRDNLLALALAVFNVTSEFPGISPEKPTVQRSEWKVFAQRIIALHERAVAAHAIGKEPQ